MNEKPRELPTDEEFKQALKVLELRISANAVTITDAENFEGTADRVYRMYNELSWSPERIGKALGKEIGRFFPSQNNEENGLGVHGPVIVNSMCPHHFMPVRYHAYVGYLPKDGKVLGISKLSRICQILGKQFVLQEQLVKYIADALYNVDNLPDSIKEHMGSDEPFTSNGSIAMLVGVHTCQSCRGVESDARTTFIERRGDMRDPSMEARFNQMVAFSEKARPFGG